MRSVNDSDVLVVGDAGDVETVAAECRTRALVVRTCAGNAALTFWRALEDRPRVVLAVRDGERRRALAVAFAHAGATFATLAPRGRWASMTLACGPGTVTASGINCGPRVRLGAHVRIEAAACLGHDSVAGDFVTIESGACVSGAVHLEAGARVGAGATILNGTLSRPLVIGANARIAPGSVVTRDVPPDIEIAGNPARETRRAEPRTHSANAPDA